MSVSLKKSERFNPRGYPWQKTESMNLPEEHWKDIPAHEGYYSISSLGRIRREPFEILCKNGMIRKMSPRIMVPEIVTAKNQTVGDKVFSLRVKIMRSGVIYQNSVPRLLYYLFIKKFNLQDYSLVIITKDGNGKNVELKNLALVNIMRKQQRIFERNRLKRTYFYTIDEFLQTGSDFSVNPFCKQVSQYDLSGKRIKTFPSVKSAALVLGISQVGILGVLKMRQVTFSGFVWAYGKKLKIDVAAIRESNLLHYKKLVGRKVSQYNLEGKRIATYLTISDAARAVGIKRGDISSVLSGKLQTAGGFIWKYGWGKHTINVKGFIYGEELRAQARWKKVKQYTSEGKYLKTFPSVKAAAVAMKCSPSFVSFALANKGRLAKGYLLKQV